MERFAIRYSKGKGAVLTAVGVPHRWAHVTLDDEQLAVRLGWAFRAAIPRRLLAAAGRGRDVPLTAGAHGWRGRWLVNGAGTGIVEIHLAEPVRAWTAGFPIKLRMLAVSLEEPERFLAELGLPGPAPS